MLPWPRLLLGIPTFSEPAIILYFSSFVQGQYEISNVGYLHILIPTTGHQAERGSVHLHLRFPILARVQSEAVQAAQHHCQL